MQYWILDLATEVDTLLSNYSLQTILACCKIHGYSSIRPENLENNPNLPANLLSSLILKEKLTVYQLREQLDSNI